MWNQCLEDINVLSDIKKTKQRRDDSSLYKQNSAASYANHFV